MKKYSGLVLILLAFFLNFGSIEAQDVVGDLLGRINNLRASLGLSPYSLNGALSAAALNQAQWMASTGEVSHTQYDGSRPVDRAQANGYASSWVAENIYMGSMAQVDDAWTFWINSSIHYAGLTSTNFRDVGIASAVGDYGQAFVLVFGNPGGGGGARPVNTTNNGGGNGAAAEVPQLAILGYDSVGNIRYQLQEGETLGDVLLIFGYTWDDLPALMALNGLTETDARNLDVGQEILVPPHGGTWTPSAGEMTAEVSADVTEPASQNLAALTLPPNPSPCNGEGSCTFPPSPTFDVRDLTPYAEETVINTSGILPTPSGSDSFILASPTVPVEQIAPPEVFVLASPSPTDASQVAAVATIEPTNTFLSVAQTPVEASQSPIIEEPAAAASQNAIPLWLIGAIVVQIGVLLFAGFEFVRRMRKA